MEFPLNGSLDSGMSRNDAKTVAILALGCFHPVTKVQSASIHFFLGSEDDNDEESEEEEEVFPVPTSIF